MATKDDFTVLWVVGTHGNIQIMYHRNVETYMILLTNVTQKKINKKKLKKEFKKENIETNLTEFSSKRNRKLLKYGIIQE